MTAKQLDREAISGQEVTILPEDSLAEAGRKILMQNLIRMLEFEAGSMSGEDMEDIHQMRVATRRMRTAFKLFGAYFKTKPIRPFTKQLKVLANLLGRVRDLDVMIDDLSQYGEGLEEEQQAALREVLTHLIKQRGRAHKKLVKYLNSDTYQTFLKSYTKFLSKPGKGTQPIEDHTTPHQVRHLLPALLHEYLANVRAYDTVLEDAPPETLHALRIEFKRLRYATTYFEEVLGSTITDFIEEIKTIQDYLGRLNDFSIAQQRLNTILESYTYSNATVAVIQAYIERLAEAESQRSDDFTEIWNRFNSRTVQRKLSDALLVLR